MKAATVYLNAFLLGFAVMGFEMLGARYLTPYLGGDIETWAALIATVLAALMIGYFLGGLLVDRVPSLAVAGLLMLAAAAYLALVPFAADPLLAAILERLGDKLAGSIAAAVALVFVPLALLGTYLPFAIRLLLDDPLRAGALSGRLYAISTFGNIFGTLFVTFFLIPTIGTKAITWTLAAGVGLCGLSMFAVGRRAR